jgi:hypothetical protein
LLIRSQLNIALSSEGLSHQALKFRDQLVQVDPGRVYFLAPREREQLRREFGAEVNGAPSRGRELFDPATPRHVFDHIEIRRDHCQQVVEVVRDASSESADQLHFLALVKLFIGDLSKGPDDGSVGGPDKREFFPNGCTR